jgi:hypothetical protein
MKKAWALFALLAVSVLPAAAQSNQVLDRLLEQPRAPFGAAACLVLSASGLIASESTEQQALEFLGRKNWRLRARDPQEPIRLGEYCYLIMKSFDLNGGFMYRMIPGPRYAARELAYLGFVRGKAHSARYPTGQEAVQILSSVLDREGGGS